MVGTSKTITAGDVDVATAFRALADRGADTAPLMRSIAAALLFGAQRRFESKRGPDGAAWPGYARSTLRRMSKRRRVPQLLRDTNRLYQSLTARSEADTARVGTNVVYAAIHQFGGTIRRAARTAVIYRRYDAKTDSVSGFVTKRRSNYAKDVTIPAHEIPIPARPYLGLSDADRAEVQRIAAAYILGERP